MQHQFDHSSYEQVYATITSDKCLVREIKNINPLNRVDLRDAGDNNNLDNVQIFTPQFIVNDMIDAIGKDQIVDVSKRILEPTSGDGAFTCRILQLRLETIDAELDRETTFSRVLSSIGTIYSIEMDEELVKRQRDNIYTIAVEFLKDKGIQLSESEDAVLRFVIVENCIWGETNIDTEPGLIDCEVAYRMSHRKKDSKQSVEFPVWGFTDSLVSLHYEAPEVGD